LSNFLFTGQQVAVGYTATIIPNRINTISIQQFPESTGPHSICELGLCGSIPPVVVMAIRSTTERNGRKCLST